MKIAPLSLRQANALVDELHRHHKPARGCRFCIGALEGDRVVGAAIVGRPVGRKVDQWSVAEVTRLVTDGTPNACSFLYGACARIARAMGFRKIQTYILASEPGTSLKAAGWVKETDTRGGDWNRPSRGERRTDQPQEPKQRWALMLEGGTKR